MNFLRRLFAPRKEIAFAEADIDSMVCYLNYEKHYANALVGVAQSYMRPDVLAELFLFRGWTTQFGFRFFSTDEAASERLIQETIDLTLHLGLTAFSEAHGFSIEGALGADYMTLVNDRWRDYDSVIVTYRGDLLPTMELMTKLTERIGVRDVMVLHKLTMDFLLHIEQIKTTALKIGLLR